MSGILKEAYKSCELCGRHCKVNRCEKNGFCGSGTEICAAKAMLHYWEEPAVTEGKGPSGAVFFSSCNLKCIYCQNYKISHESFGKEISAAELAAVFLNLKEKGAVNIDLVTPSHFLPGITEAIDIIGKEKLGIPVVYNCGGYENPQIIKEIRNYVDIWLPDLKYYDDEVSVKYSGAPHYFETACSSLKEMISQGKKVIVRHMVLPGQREDSVRLLNALYERFGTESFLISLMSQYTPFYKACEHKEINRRVTTFEYERVLNEAVKLGFKGYMQERTSAKEEYTPVFDLDGLPPFKEI